MTHPGPSSTGPCGPIHVSWCKSCSRYPGAATSHSSSSFPRTFHRFLKPICPQCPLLQEIQGNNDFGSVPQHLAPGSAQAEFPDPWAHRAPIRDYPQADSADNFGRLARHYMDHPDSQVTQVDRVVRMVPGHARRLEVVITLELPNAL
jgi:hypothetical protein